MRLFWSEEEIEFIKINYLSGLTKIEVYNQFILEFGNTRSCDAIVLKIKRLKLKHTLEQLMYNKSKARIGELNPMFGKESWCKGKTKENNEIINQKSIGLSKTRKQMFENGLLNVFGENNGMYGKKSWSNGLTKDTDNRLKLLGMQSSKNAKLRWNNYSQEEKDLVVQRLNNGNKKKRKETKIEKKIKLFLQSLNLEFYQEFTISKFVLDFYLPNHNLVIECQGDYYHANPRKYNIENYNSTQIANIKRDIKKKEFIKENNFKSLFIWEYDINNNFIEVQELIRKEIQ